MPIDLSVLNLTKENQEILSFLIGNNESLYNLYMDKYHGEYPNQLLAVANFRLHIRMKNKMSYPEFANNFSSGKQEALQKQFQIPVTPNDVIRLERLFREGQIDLREVYDRSSADPHLKLVRLLHDKRYCLKVQELLEKRLK
jgi:hypothetical protein